MYCKIGKTFEKLLIANILMIIVAAVACYIL